MKAVSLFTGAGGGELATQHLLGWETIGYNEMADYPVQVLHKRIAEGNLHDAPVYHMPLEEFNADHAREYAGRPDIITAGFPCQPFSCAGKQLADRDPRNAWPETRDAIRIIRPRFALLENVPTLLAGSHGYFGQVLGDLAEMGYDARWGVLSAAEAGAPHKRARFWCLAYANGEEWWEWSEPESTRAQTIGGGEESGEGHGIMADADGQTRGFEGCAGEAVLRPEEVERSGRRGAGTQWPTIRSSDADRGGRGDLIQAARGNENSHFRMWPTARANQAMWSNQTPESAHATNRKPNLETIVARRTWGPPRATEYKGCGPHGSKSQQHRLGKGYLDAQAAEEEHDSDGPSPTGTLNPDWVAWLMGWPIGWEDVDQVPDVEAWKRATMNGTWWETDPADVGAIPRLVKGATMRANRLKALGNGQVPAQAVLAVSMLT